MSKYKIGPMPLNAYLCCFIVCILGLYFNVMPKGMVGGFAVLLLVGWLLWTIGENIPFLKQYGGPAILCLVVPSVIIYFNSAHNVIIDGVKTDASWHLPIIDNALKMSNELMKKSNWLYFYISSLVCGSILGMHRKVLIQGFFRMLPSIFFGSLIGIAVGIGIGYIFNHNWQYSLFYIITPIMAGGVGEGVLPLSQGYSQILGIPQDQILGPLMPGLVLGNFAAIFFSAAVNRFGEIKPQYSGKGQLVKVDPELEKEILAIQNDNSPIDLSAMACGVALAGTMMTVGNLLEHLTTFPGAVLMIIATAVLKYLNVIPEFIQMGARQLYQFMSKYFTAALMAGLGFGYISLGKAIEAFTIESTIIIIFSVLSLSLTGWFLAKMMGLYEVESSIIAACHSGMGGTGDVAILTTANRMHLMPFAQVATRLGGALTVIAVLSIMKMLDSPIQPF